MKLLKLSFLILLAQLAVGQNLKLDKSELIFPLQEQHTHGSSIVELPNGDLLVAWFHGSGERKSDDVRIMGARLKKGAKKWSNPFELADTPHLPDCNPVLFLNHDKKLFLVWIAVQANQWEGSVLRVRTTLDYNQDLAPNWTWQDNILLKPGEEFQKEIEAKFKDLPKNTHGWAEYAKSYDQQIIDASSDLVKRSFGWMTRIKPLLLPNKKIVLPLYSDGYNLSLMAISDDDGATWKPSLPLVGRGPIQPALTQMKDGTLVAYMRDSGDAPTMVHISSSKDLGNSWSASQKTDIPNTASVEALVLKNGIWLLLGNDVSDGRYVISLYVSDDEGKTWKWKHKLENSTKQSGHGYSYPAMIQSNDGHIHITYTYALAGNQKAIKYLKLQPGNLTK